MILLFWIVYTFYLIKTLKIEKKKKKEQDMEQQTGAKLGKEYIKAIYCHPVFLTYMQCSSSKMPGWMKHNLESRNINNLIYADDTSFMAESEEELKSVLMKVKKVSEKAGSKFNIQKTNLVLWSAHGK